ncbi:M48 family metallopeptidase [Ideonella azotifigens]|uniref:SprT family zinc-dependent metalloprotease n=1 Tax=Ideonella azotifigens TaxID=513160 RepID=A0ABP3VMQ4_9BURK|nr:SprT family zinc-dependent metalloprotease [Ideonella azotifigens]MCD2344542.1 M48 family metallopeptidase [Ideonella azotifigens]
MAPRRDAALPRQMSLFDLIDAAFPSLTGAFTAPSTPAPAALSQPPAVQPPPPAPPPGPRPFDYTHAKADREIRLGDCRVGYLLRRARRKSIGFSIGPDGLAVSAPRWVGIGDIEQALRDKSGWILRKLAEQRERGRRLQAARIEWHDGTSLPYLGETLIVVLDPRATGARLNSDAQALPGVPRLTLHLGLSHNASAEQIRDTVQAWLQREARKLFEERCAHFAQRLGVRVTRMRLSSAQTRWGSASADGSIRLNWRLVHFGLSVIDYVVAHELAHLREMNHSPAFWDVVRSVIPDLDERKAQLRSPVVPLLD